VARQINASINRRRVWESVRRSAFYVAAAAACILVGIDIGKQQYLPAPSAPSAVNQNVAMNSNTGNSNLANSSIVNSNGGAVPVNILDSNGRVVAMPSFQTIQEATDFARQFNNPNNTPVRASYTGDLGQNVVPVSDVQQF